MAFDFPSSPTVGQQYQGYSWDGSAWKSAGLGDVSNLPIRGYLHGLTLSTAGASTTFSVAIGLCANSVFNDLMAVATAINKTTAAWAVGSGNGALDASSIAASTWYHVFVIKRPDTGVVDILISLSATAPTLPANYTMFRRIGSLRTNGSSQWHKFVQYNDEFWWDVAEAGGTPFINSASGSTSAVTRTATVPTGVIVQAIFGAQLNAVGADANALFSPLDISDQSAGGVISLSAKTGQLCGAEFRVRTNTSGQIRSRAATTGAVLYATTSGWVDLRGKDA